MDTEVTLPSAPYEVPGFTVSPKSSVSYMRPMSVSPSAAMFCSPPPRTPALRASSMPMRLKHSLRLALVWSAVLTGVCTGSAAVGSGLSSCAVGDTGGKGGARRLGLTL